MEESETDRKNMRDAIAIAHMHAAVSSGTSFKSPTLLAQQAYELADEMMRVRSAPHR